MNIIRELHELRAVGEMPKSIYEYVGRTFGYQDLSLAQMVSPAGWSEPGQRPEFREIIMQPNPEVPADRGEVERKSVLQVSGGPTISMPNWAAVRVSDRITSGDGAPACSGNSDSCAG